MRLHPNVWHHQRRPRPSLRELDTPRCAARTVSLTVGAVLLAAGCTSTPESSEALDPPEEAAVDQPAAEPEPAAPEPPSDESPADEPPDPEQLPEVWETFHDAWVEQAALDEPDAAVFTDLASDPTAAADALVAQRGDARMVTVDTELWPDVELEGVESAAITDCVIVEQHPADQPDSTATVTVAWEVQAAATDDGWRIEDARATDLFCVAEELNEQLLSAYRDFRAAKDAAWDPPDPDHPELDRTMAGDQLAFIRELLAEHEREGIVIREPAATDDAVVFEVGIGVATVSDCTEQVPEYGAYDLDTGERLDDVIAPVEEGRLDAQSVELERFSGGNWRVTDQAASRDTDCVVGSTRYATP
jgi:hypothetical protein